MRIIVSTPKRTTGWKSARLRQFAGACFTSVFLRMVFHLFTSAKLPLVFIGFRGAVFTCVDSFWTIIQKLGRPSPDTFSKKVKYSDTVRYVCFSKRTTGHQNDRFRLFTGTFFASVFFKIVIFSSYSLLQLPPVSIGLIFQQFSLYLETALCSYLCISSGGANLAPPVLKRFRYFVADIISP